MINLIVTMIIKEGKLDVFLAECAKVRPQVLSEKGCVAYDYTVDVPTAMTRQEAVNALRVTLFECWETLQDLEAHSATQHMQDYVEKVKDMRESVVIRVTQAAF